jgi:hypothetical protein
MAVNYHGKKFYNIGPWIGNTSKASPSNKVAILERRRK